MHFNEQSKACLREGGPAQVEESRVKTRTLENRRVRHPARLFATRHVCRRSITLREKIGNPEKTARSYVTLGEIQHRSGDDQSAEESLRRVLALKLNVHGFEHPDLIVTLRRCAGVLRARHKIQEALDLENRADRIRERFNLPAYIEESCNDDHLS